MIELDPVDRLTTDAIGPPGERVFYLQGRKGDRLITVVVEKQQVQLLAASVIEILSRIGQEVGEGPPEEAMELEEPLLPEWRAGRLSIGYHEDRDLLLLEIEELVPEEGESEGGQAEAWPGDGPSWEEPEEGGEPGPRVAGLGEIDPPGSGQKEPNRIRFWATKEQMLSLARHGAAVCAAGRPRCQFCGNPMDPEGHICPAMNGHGERREA